MIVALVFAGLQMNAQDKKRDKIREGRQDRMAMMNDLSAEEMANLKTKKMTLHLDLTSAQQEKVKAIVLEESQMRKAKMLEMKSKKDAGTLQKPSKEQRLEMMNARLDKQIAMKAKMKDILNEEQYARWEQSMSKRSHRKGSKDKRHESKRK